MKEGIYQGFRGVVGNIITVLNKVIDGVEDMINFTIDGLNEVLVKADELSGGKN